MENIVGKLAAAFGAFAIVMALWVPNGEFWRWFWTGIILLFVSLFTTAWYRQKHGDKSNHG